MVRKTQGFKIYGRVLREDTGEGIQELIVKAIDKDLLFDDLLGAVTTDENGYFEINYDKEDFQELFFDRKPDIYLVIKSPDGKIIHSTKDKVRYGAQKTEEFKIIITESLILKNKNFMKEKAKVHPLEVSVELKELKKEQEWPNMAAFVFSRSGRLLDKQPLKPDPKKANFGTVKFQITTNLQNVIIKVGPDVPDTEMFEKYQPVTERILLPEKPKIKFVIEKLFWICWLKIPYFINGTVKKQKPGPDAPICAGEVDIYDVDIKYCFYKLPDFVIERIRDGILDVVVDPPPIDPPVIDFEKPIRWWDWEDDGWCGTVPRPPFPPKRVDIQHKLETLPKEWAFAKQRYQMLPEARTRMNKTLNNMSLIDQRSFLNTELVEGVKISQLLYTNTTQFRTLLFEKFVVIKFWLCWWPWIYWLWWPYCGYSLEKLGTATLQADGSFSKTVWLSVCRHDTPDLWFVVKQKINGIERVIYARHPVPCNTYWNHPSGQPVHLLVTDPNAIACHQPVPGIGDPYVLPMGIYEDEWYDVNQAHIISTCDPATPLPSTCGLYKSSDPYGTRLDLRMQFHDDIYNNGIRFYRWSYRKHGNTLWVHIDTPIIHRYIKQVAPGDYSVIGEELGPVSLAPAGEDDLFKVPDPDKSWLDNRNDLAYAIWYTAKWNGSIYIPQISDGKYDLRLEMFDSGGVKVKPSVAGFKFVLPTAYLGPLDDALFIEADGSLIMHLHIDNKDTVADILSVALNGMKAGDCQFLEYDNKEIDTVDIEYVAYHPTTSHNFLHHYTMNIRRGISGTYVGSVYETTSASSPTTRSFFVKDLLGAFDRCAFAIWLHSWPRTRDGHSRIRAYEAGDSSAFALVKK